MANTSSVSVPVRRFTELHAYRSAVLVAEFLYPRVRHWAPFERDTIGLQLIRSAETVGANIAEATGRWNTPDQRRMLIIARGSLLEAAHWVRRAQRLGLLNAEIDELLDKAGKTLNGLIRSLSPSPKD